MTCLLALGVPSLVEDGVAGRVDRKVGHPMVIGQAYNKPGTDTDTRFMGLLDGCKDHFNKYE